MITIHLWDDEDEGLFVRTIETTQPEKVKPHPSPVSHPPFVEPQIIPAVPIRR